MTGLHVSVKWAGTKFDKVPVDTSAPGLALKETLSKLSGVPTDRQKIMVKGGMLKDDADMGALGLKEGQVLMMMGTAGELPKAPPAPVVFMEDMSDAQIAQALKLPMGLVNLGNTCYLNATLQCLRAVPELQTVFQKMPSALGSDAKANLVATLGTLFKELTLAGDSVPPIAFLQMFRTVYPQFAERDASGFMQQDAEEAWGQIIQVLNEKVPGLGSDKELSTSKRFVEQFMTVDTVSTITCDEAPQETPGETAESFTKMRINIGTGVATYMTTDMATGFTEKIEKNSPTLGRTAVYTKTTKICRLPEYLCVNFVRFQWKPQERVKAKILKKVKFPFDLDMSPLCVPALSAKFQSAKDRLKELDDIKALAKKQKLDPALQTSADASGSKTKKDQRVILKELGVDATLLEDVGANASGQYDLVAVLTHVGRAADSGHYIGWVKDTTPQAPNAPQKAAGWLKFDDDRVSPCSEEEISRLEGGGDWHTAYICLYRAKQLE